MEEIKRDWIYKIYLGGIFIILFLPLLNIQPWFAPPDWGKTIIFKIVFSVLIFFFLWQILDRKITFQEIIGKLKSVSFLFSLLAVFAGLIILSTIFSEEPGFSFWGSPYRSGSALNSLFYILFSLFLFLIIRKNDWSKIWIFSMVVGVLVSFIAFLQYFKIFPNVVIPYQAQVPSTIGGPGFLGLYLSLLLLLGISFALAEKNKKKKVFYFISSLVLLLAIVLTNSQGAFLALGLSIFYFLFFYPFKSKKKSSLAKGLLILLAVFGLTVILFVKNHPETALAKNKLTEHLVSWRVDQSRLSAWKVSFRALKDRPILGYGPENFSIPFDKHYDPSLPTLERQPGGVATRWWDRAHNFVFEIALTLGIPALIIYLLIFAVLFWQLEKLKKYQRKSAQISINPHSVIIYHGIQAAFVFYLADSFFNFDTFSSFIVIFAIIAYSLYLISSSSGDASQTTNQQTDKAAEKNKRTNKILSFLLKTKWVILSVLGIFLIFFIWNYNLKPLQINKEVNWATYYSQNKQCQKAIDKMEKILPSQSIIDNYLQLVYVEVLKNCSKLYPGQNTAFAQKAIEVLRKAIKSRPTYTRSWLFLGTYLNIYVENNKNLTKEQRTQLLKEADSALAKALELSPKRQEVVITYMETDFLAGKYKEAKEKAELCIQLNPKWPDCYWRKALLRAKLGELKEAAEDLEAMVRQGYPYNQGDNPLTRKSITELLNIYVEITKNSSDLKYYKRLAELYGELIYFEPKNFQYHASLAYVYKAMAEYQKSADEAIYTLDLSPESLGEVEKFLNGLPKNPKYYTANLKYYQAKVREQPQNPNYRLVLALTYKMTEEYEKAKEEAKTALELGLSPLAKKLTEDFLKTLP